MDGSNRIPHPEVRDIYEENQKLKEHLTKYAEVSVEADDLRRENEELRQMVEASDSSLRDFELIPAESHRAYPERLATVRDD